MKYSEILKYLMNITDQKVQDVADLLFYDISYISKWINGKSLPAITKVSETHTILSEVFSNILFHTKEKYKLPQKFNMYTDLEIVTQSTLNKFLYNVLTIKFFEEYNKDNKNPLDATAEESKVIIGKKNIIDFLLLLFSTDLKQNNIEIYSTLPQDSLIKMLNLFNKLWFFGLKSPVQLNFLIDSIYEKNDFDDLMLYLKTIGQLSYYDINIYKNIVNKKIDHYIYVKDRFVLFFQGFTNNNPMLLTFSKNPELLKSLNKYNNQFFKSCDPVLKTVDNFTYEKYYYEKNLSSKNKKIFTSYVDGCFLDNNILSKVSCKNKLNPKHLEIIEDVSKLQKYSFKNKDYEIIFNAASLSSSIEQQKISIGSYYFKLEQKDYIDYLNKLYEKLETYNQIYHIIDSKYLTNYNWDYFMSFILTSNSFIMKKVDAFNSEKFKYIISTDNSLISLFNRIYTSLLRTNYIKAISIEEIKEFVESKILSMQILSN